MWSTASEPRALGKTLFSQSAPLHLGLQMGTGEYNAGSNAAMD